MLISKEINVRFRGHGLQVPLIRRQQLKAVPLSPDITVEEAKATELSYLVADRLGESDAEEVDDLLRGGLLRHVQVTRDHGIEPLVLRGRAALPIPPPHACMYAFDDGEDPEQIFSDNMGSAAPPALQFLLLRADPDRYGGLPLLRPEREVVLDRPVVEGADQGIEVEIFGAVDRRNELSERGHRGFEGGREWRNEGGSWRVSRAGQQRATARLAGQ